MSKYEIISIIISTIAVGVSIFAIFKSNCANKLSKDYNSIAMGQSETCISQAITQAKQAVSALTSQIAFAGELNDTQQKVLKQTLKTNMENTLNAYESACSVYLDKKIDQDRFKKSYKTEIKQLVEDKSYDSYFFPEAKSRYKAILKVYDQWENLEQ